MKPALIVLALAWPIALAQPRLASGRLESTAASSSMAQQIRGFGAGPAWVGYTIDAVPAQRGCCYSINNGVCSTGCALEGGAMTGTSCPADSTVFLEGERTANILMRIDKGEVERVRVFSPSCQLDISGLTLHWLTGVREAESVAYLHALSVKGSNIVGAIAAHTDPSAEQFLRQTAESASAQRRDRERAAMWLALTRGASGFAVVKRLVETDADDQFRSQLTSAIAQAPDGAGTGELIDLATRDKSRRVRERAFFWLGRAKDASAQKFVSEILSK